MEAKHVLEYIPHQQRIKLRGCWIRYRKVTNIMYDLTEKQNNFQSAKTETHTHRKCLHKKTNLDYFAPHQRQFWMIISISRIPHNIVDKKKNSLWRATNLDGLLKRSKNWVYKVSRLGRIDSTKSIYKWCNNLMKYDSTHKPSLITSKACLLLSDDILQPMPWKTDHTSRH